MNSLESVKGKLFFITNKFNKFLGSHWLYIVLIFWFILLGSWARLFGMANLGYIFDTVTTQFEWGRSAYNLGGLYGFWQNYPLFNFYDYPPLSLVYEHLLAAIVNFIKGDLETNQNTFVFLLKITNWLVEIVFCAFLYWLGISYGGLKKIYSALLSSFIYLLPSFWFVSGVWGQNDTLIAFLTLISLVLLASEGAQNKYFGINLSYFNFFLSGLVLAIGFNIKQQPILLLPAIVIFFIQSKNFWQLLKTLIISAIGVAPVYLIVELYAQNYEKYDFNNFSLAQLGLDLRINQWLIYLTLIVVIYLSILFILTIYKSKLQNLSKFLLGFWLIFWIIQLPLFYLNPIRSASILATPNIRDNNISEGADTFWSLLDPITTGQKESALSNLIESSFINVSIADISNKIYLGLMVVFTFYMFDIGRKLKSFFKIKPSFQSLLSQIPEFTKAKFNLLDLSILMSISSFAYFLFMTKIHSRYLHLGLVFMFASLFVWGLRPYVDYKLRLQWLLATLLTSLAYFLNQVWVLGYSNPEPRWVKDWIEAVKFEIGNLNSVIYILAFIWMFSLGIKHFSSKYQFLNTKFD